MPTQCFEESGEGWFDPWILLRALKRKCQSLGVNILKGYPVSATTDNVTGRVLSVDVLEQQSGKETIHKYNVDNVVNAAGAACSQLMKLLANDKLTYPMPVEPRKRCIFFFHCATNQNEIVPRIAPLAICPISNVYFRSEGHVPENGEASGNFLCGVSPKKEKDHVIHDFGNLDFVDHELWDEIIWPALYHRVPAFGEVKLRSSWAGLYECEYD
jgi:FAD-dependent oxidoreductase domain-containing protein 1